MAKIFVYTARRLPLSTHELEHVETCGGGAPGDHHRGPAGAALFLADSGTYCCVVCGRHQARTALAWNRRR
jgi:hypothetical protein